MPLKYFLIYAGGSLAVAIVFVTIAKSYAPGFAQGIKKPLISGLLLALGIAASGYLVTLLFDDLFTVFWFLAGIFLAGGIVYRLLLHNKYFRSERGKSNYYRVFTGELLFLFGTFLFAVLFFSCLEYFLGDKNFLFYPALMSGLTFFLPLLSMNAFDAAYAIPEPDFSKWSYPNSPIKFQKLKQNEKELLIAFELSKTSSDKMYTNFRARGPESMLLGDLFYHFINDYNEDQEDVSIEMTNGHNEPHEWRFRRKPKWYQRQRVFDPDVDLYKNMIKENTIVICERVNINQQ